MKTDFELPEDRLATTDATGKRVYLYPADVKGKLKKYKKLIHTFLMVVFLVLPWIKINGYQSILLDIPQRRFAILGITFWAHDIPMLVFVFGSIFVGIALITALFGRIWCGWACPETVFIESVYRRIERLVEGDGFTRKKRDQAPVSLDLVFRRSIKWTLFVLVTLVITHSFLAYFVGTEKLLQMMRHSPYENPGTFLFMAASSGVLLFAFGWFREQFCIIACPYGRFQSVLMDEHSLVITYDQKRGEPRRGSEKENQTQGDCVNCYRCVQVCPTGIDIRRGVQMECIACTACIDACNEVMHKVHKPQGLIRYDTEVGLQGKKTNFIRLRTAIYSVILLIILSGLGIALNHRDLLPITVLKTRGTPYEVLNENEIINRFTLNISNQSFESKSLKILEPTIQGVSLAIASKQIQIAPGKDYHGDFFIRFPKTLLQNGSGNMEIIFEENIDNKSVFETLPKVLPKVLKENLHLVGPF